MQTVIHLVMIVALFAFILTCALGWAGIAFERVTLVSMGVVGTATGLNFIGAALMPRWERAWWKPTPGSRATVRLGRLSSIGVGIWFGTVGVAFLGAGWLTEHILPGILGGFAAGFVLVMAGSWYDGRRAEAARAAVRRRGWVMAARREDDALPADQAQLRQDAREGLCWSIQRNLRGRTTLEQIETEHRYLVAVAGSAGSPADWPEVAEEWRTFRSAFAESDEVWKFNTASARRGGAGGAEGFARLRRGTVVDWFITAVVG